MLSPGSTTSARRFNTSLYAGLPSCPIALKLEPKDSVRSTAAAASEDRRRKRGERLRSRIILPAATARHMTSGGVNRTL